MTDRDISLLKAFVTKSNKLTDRYFYVILVVMALGAVGMAVA